MKEKNIVLSGIRATGRSHLGNYIGAYRFFAELAKNPQNQCFYFVANLHTLTTRTDPKALRDDLRGIVLDFLGSGIDPEKAIIYAQSSIPEITELAWILGCITSVGNLLSMPHFKEKRKAAKTESAITENAGLLYYPVLMAADILVVKANLVPVGQDQHPHVELTRDLAHRFNTVYGKKVFPIPDLLEGEGIRLPGLKGRGKMSKSEEDDVIYLIDSPEVVKTKIHQAVTDPNRIRRTDPGNPQICNIYTFHTLFSEAGEITRVGKECQTAAIGCIECKDILIKHVNILLQKIQDRRKGFEDKGPEFIDELIHQGGRQARERIQNTVNEVKDLAGIPLY